MKKNLRIVSATAAALLAVAPVAAASVAPVFASDTNVTVDGGTGNISGTTAKFSLNVTNAYALSDGDPASSLKVTLANPTLPNGATISKVSNAKVYKAGKVSIANNAKVSGITADDVINNLSLKDGDKSAEYEALAYVTIGGLKANTEYTITLGQTDYKITSDNTGYINNLPVLSNKFSVGGAKLAGTPYVTERTNDKVLTSGSYDLKPADYSVSDLAKALTDDKVGAFKAGVSKPTGTDTDAASASFINPQDDVRAALKNAGIATKGTTETFDKPATSFVVTLNVAATNGKTLAFPVTVDPNATTADVSFPVISYNVNGVATSFPNFDAAKGTVDKSASKTLDNIDDLTFGNVANAKIDFNYVPVNGVVDVNGIKKAFTAQVNTNNKDVLGIDVDVSKVNTKVAGKYPVVVSATNTDKKTTKVTFMLTVGAKGATYKTVQSNGDVPVYKIDGNTVTDTKTTVKNGDTIAVFGDAVKIGDKSYTRINSADSDLYVESQYVDGSFKPAPSVAKKVMHNSYIYDANHKRVGDKTLAAYTNINVYGDATKLADGSLVYKIGDNQFVMADNIDGTSRTLTHNAYVYKTSKKRADRRVLKKGTKVTTYGNPYKFKNGMSYYRIGGPAKQYVKVANF